MLLLGLWDGHPGPCRRSLRPRHPNLAPSSRGSRESSSRIPGDPFRPTDRPAYLLITSEWENLRNPPSASPGVEGSAVRREKQTSLSLLPRRGRDEAMKPSVPSLSSVSSTSSLAPLLGPAVQRNSLSLSSGCSSLSLSVRQTRSGRGGCPFPLSLSEPRVRSHFEEAESSPASGICLPAMAWAHIPQLCLRMTGNPKSSSCFLPWEMTTMKLRRHRKTKADSQWILRLQTVPVLFHSGCPGRAGLGLDLEKSPHPVSRRLRCSIDLGSQPGGSLPGSPL